MHEFSRLELLIQKNKLEKLKNSHVAIFGIGGVGGNCIETLARSGVQKLSIYDNDVVSITNINRQIIALHSTINQKKTTVMKHRLADINPLIEIYEHDMFIDKHNIDTIQFSDFDYVVDAIDTISAKLLLIEKCEKINLPIISCMGTGNKLDPSQLKIMDIYKTNYCPLAKVMRHELKKRNISKLKVLSSHEKPIKPFVSDEVSQKRHIPGSTSFVPSVAGIIIASEVIKDLI